MSMLYACLRSPRRPDVAVAVAKAFSPRLQRYGNACVVLDVGGLGRLLGEAQTIGELIAEQLNALIPDRSDDLRRSARGASREEDLRRSASREEARSAPSASRAPDPRSRVAIAATQIGAMLLSSAHPGLTVVTGDIASALAPVRLDVLRQVAEDIHDITMSAEAPWRSLKSASREEDPARSAGSASRDPVNPRDPRPVIRVP